MECVDRPSPKNVNKTSRVEKKKHALTVAAQIQIKTIIPRTVHQQQTIITEAIDRTGML